ncbi:MAG: ATP-binding cassette domain-containing protein [Thermoflexales bacterium]|nr:ATP-binding cassette domain-containing protein [Thermoflexales bacterium]
MTNIVEVKDLVKKYPGTAEPAVRGVSFAIKQGEIFGFLGPNGAGKTTTISMLSSLLVPTSGTATVAGFDLIKQAANVKRHIGLVPQDLALYPTISARDNLNFFGRIYGLSGKVLKQRVDDALNMVGLFDRANDAVEKFSGGMKRRVNIAAGLLHQPDVLFLDEPTVGVDPQSRNFIFDNVEELNKRGLTVLYTTHYMEEAERLCDRVAIIDQGRIVALDTPAALQASIGGGMVIVGVPDGVPAELDAELRAAPTVNAVSRIDHQIKVKALNTQAALVGVINAFNRNDITIRSLDVLEPNLETVFLELTGKRLRD